MTKKDYVRFARLLKDARAIRLSGAPVSDETRAVTATVIDAVVGSIEDELVAIFQADNARFDVARFRQACR